jgi:PTS system nitrogen regulatory IIA component
MLKFSERKVVRLVKWGGLPAQTIAGQLRFNRMDVLDWAIAHQTQMAERPADESTLPPPHPSLAAALESGGIHHEVPGDDREAALRSVVARLPLPKDFDRESLFQLFMAREARGSTAVGDGIAIPHVRRPIVLHVPRTLMTLCFLARPIAYEAPDGRPVQALFSVLSATVADHVRLLDRLARALHDARFRKSVAGTEPREAILRAARRLDEAEGPGDGNGPLAA